MCLFRNDDSPVVSFVAPTVKNQAVLLLDLSIVDRDGNTNTEQFHVIVSKKALKDKNEDQSVQGKSEPLKKIKLINP